ncbi:MAG: hypothetical protein M3O34_12675, partial [Chloroflexota bacterium]|nr:hypothetical protein [Chloroflexota bacterium]
MATAPTQTAWQLSAPESFVLLNGPKAVGAEAFKLGVLELVTRNVFKIVNVEEPGMRGRRKTTAVLVEGTASSAASGAALQSIVELYRQQRQRTFKDGTIGVPVAELARAATRRYKTLAKYRDQEILPSLVERGLYRREERRTLGIFKSTRYELTPEGEAARSDLESRIELANREFGGWVRGEPARAMAFAGLAGAALLMMPSVYPELQLMAEGMPAASDFAAGDAGSVGGSTGAGLDVASTGGAEVGGLDLGGLDMNSLSALDLSAFDSIGDAFSAIDSGVD